MADRSKNQVNIRNKRASFEYHLEKFFDAGIALTGPEVKSLRAGKASISEAYCYLTDDGIFIKGMHISEFALGGYVDQKPLRDRRLLLTKNEIHKLRTALKDVGYTLIPVEVFFSESGYAKVKIALARGKKNFDKREDLKNKDFKREIGKYV
ncbi:MAG: SsrA-binding protein SmpB [Bacteroidetes bacterium]|nr:SsrA-binding protein SmpB [Bacteroidota bacterium]